VIRLKEDEVDAFIDNCRIEPGTLEHLASEDLEYDALHANYWVSGALGHRLKHELDVPLVATFHTLARVKADAGVDDDPEQRRRDIIEAVKRVDSGDGVAILTDMFGGTPSNLSISVMGRPQVEVLAGINLPMLVKLAKVRDECPLQDAVLAAQEAGRKYITVASRVLNGK